MSMRPELSSDAADVRIDAEAPVDAQDEHGAEDGSRTHLERGNNGPKTGGAHERARDGERGSDGGHDVPSAIELFGGLHNVPGALRDSVEQALIRLSGGITEAGAQLFKRDLGKLASEVTARRIAREARWAVRKLKPVIERIGMEEQAASVWGQMTIEEQKQARYVIDWQLRRDYFKGYCEAAKQASTQARVDLVKDPHSIDAQQRLRTAELAEAAATVSPIAGRLPVNHELAGKMIPVDQLPPAYREQGVKFTDTGFPDFESHARPLPNGEKYVEIQLTGSRRDDSAAANEEAGYSRTPAGYTWHHSEELGRMYLVPLDLHYEVKHTGGVATYKHVTGDVKPYRS